LVSMFGRKRKPEKQKELRTGKRKKRKKAI
jgi:hypothetical protein